MSTDMESFMREGLEKLQYNADELKRRRRDLEKITAVQCTEGNWNYDPYMHGMANGLILALATINGTEPTFLEAPDVWESDKIETPTMTIESESTK